ncbi:MAG: hypothetical protein GY849_02455 [Deltaproteobacteria bacterium]|nr:hypothetical protein [Deltaproteobacteria bacterium]
MNTEPLFNEKKIVLLIARYLNNSKQANETIEHFKKNIIILIKRELKMLAKNFGVNIVAQKTKNNNIYTLLGEFMTAKTPIYNRINNLYNCF